MAYKKNRKTLSVDIDKDVCAAFQAQWKARKQYQNAAAEAAIKLWIDLPVEAQARLLDDDKGSNSLVELVREIVDERIDAGRRAGKALLERQKRKQSPKG